MKKYFYSLINNILIVFILFIFIMLYYSSVNGLIGNEIDECYEIDDLEYYKYGKKFYQGSNDMSRPERLEDLGRIREKLTNMLDNEVFNWVCKAKWGNEPIPAKEWFCCQIEIINREICDCLEIAEGNYDENDW